MEYFSLRYFKPSGLILLVGIMVLGLFFANKFISNHWGISMAVFSTIISLVKIIDKHLWNKWPFRFLYSVPDFTGRYSGVLNAEFRDEKGKRITKSLEHIKIISQNGSDIVIDSWTKKTDGDWSSKSNSLNASIIREKNGSFYLLYNYLNEGSTEQQFSPHFGTEQVKLIYKGEGKHLVGKYYTERIPYQTKGKISLKFISKNLSHEIF